MYEWERDPLYETLFATFHQTRAQHRDTVNLTQDIHKIGLVPTFRELSKTDPIFYRSMEASTYDISKILLNHRVAFKSALMLPELRLNSPALIAQHQLEQKLGNHGLYELEVVQQHWGLIIQELAKFREDPANYPEGKASMAIYTMLCPLWFNLVDEACLGLFRYKYRTKGNNNRLAELHFYKDPLCKVPHAFGATKFLSGGSQIQDIKYALNDGGKLDVHVSVKV